MKNGTRFSKILYEVRIWPKGKDLAGGKNSSLRLKDYSRRIIILSLNTGARLKAAVRCFVEGHTFGDMTLLGLAVSECGQRT